MSGRAEPARLDHSGSHPLTGRRLVVMARWPAPGRCKRRLAVVLGDQRAARVQQRLTAHDLEVARIACAASAAELVLATSGLGAGAARRWGQDQAVDRVVPQGNGSLGLRLQRQVVRARRERIGQLVLIGSDLPELEPRDLVAAFRVLERGTPLVLGPATDGGYWLIGIDLRPRPAARCGMRLFAGSSAAIDWGSAKVLQQTLEAAASENLAVWELGRRSDLDRPGDLKRWR